MATEYKGSCLCGQVRYSVAGAIEDVSHCHCSMCRKAHGAAFATYANVPAAAHRFVQGTELLRVFNSSGHTERVFCSACGSPMLWRNPVEFSGIASFPLGSLDTPFRPAVERHIFVGSKALWHQIGDTWPQSVSAVTLARTVPVGPLHLTDQHEHDRRLQAIHACRSGGLPRAVRCELPGVLCAERAQ